MNIYILHLPKNYSRYSFQVKIMPQVLQNAVQFVFTSLNIGGIILLFAR